MRGRHPPALCCTFSDFFPQTASEHLVLLSSLFLCAPCFFLHLCWRSVCVKDYITVSQLSQIFGMQRIDPSSSSSLPSFQLATSETTFSCHSTPSTFPSAQVCCNCSLVCLIFLRNGNTIVRTFFFPHICSMLLSLMPLLCCQLLLCLGAVLSPQSQPELRRNVMPPINLERWYQDIMAAVEPQSCPPPLPAKSFSARRHGQVNDPTLCLCLL